MADDLSDESDSERGLEKFRLFFSFSWKAQLDQARTALGQSRNLLVECNKDEVREALETNDSSEEIVQALQLLRCERDQLQMDLHLIEEKGYSLKTPYQARRIKSKSEELQRLSEHVRTIIDERLHVEQTSFRISELSNLSDNTPPRDDLPAEHPQLTVPKDAQVDLETVSKMVQELVPAAAQSGSLGNYIIIQHSTIHQNSSINHSSLRQSLKQTASNKQMSSYTCPYCPTQISFDSRIALTAHMDKAHKVRKQES